MAQGQGAPLETTVQLIARVRAGDKAALETLFARHQGPLRRWASGRLPRWARRFADTADLVQDALLQTFKRIEEFEPRGAGALQAYLRQSFLNRLRDELRRHGREPRTSGLDDTGAASLTAIEGRGSPLEQAIGRENLERYEAALARLRPEEREALIGRIEMGYSYQELAEVLSRPSAEAARKATARALVRLAEEMRRA